MTERLVAYQERFATVGTIDLHSSSYVRQVGSQIGPLIARDHNTFAGWVFAIRIALGRSGGSGACKQLYLIMPSVPSYCSTLWCALLCSIMTLSLFGHRDGRGDIEPELA